MRAIALLCALFALGGAVAAVATSGADAASRTPKKTAAKAVGADVVGQIQRLQRTPWHWQSVLGRKRPASSFSAARSTDAGGPYYGGLQMDLGFQRHYGGYLLATKGTADRWTPVEQMWVAARAYRSGRGFYPWPSTARVCGLI